MLVYRSLLHPLGFRNRFSDGASPKHIIHAVVQKCSADQSHKKGFREKLGYESETQNLQALPRQFFPSSSIAQAVMLPWQQHTVAISALVLPFGSKHTTRLDGFFCSSRRLLRQVLCCLPLSARQKDSHPGPISSVPSLATHAWHAVTDMSNVPRTPATPSVPPPEPCVLACRNLRCHHTSITHRRTGSK
jgi:hypothetical protein